MKPLPFRTLLVIVSLLLCAIAPSRSARAEGKPPSPLSHSLTGEAKAAYNNARLLFDDGDYAGALAKFSQAYEVSHEPRLLWNLAVCEKALRHYARTASLLDRYLTEGGSKLTAEQRAQAVETRDALGQFYSLIKLKGAPDGASVSVDGEHVGTVPLAQPLLVDLGAHVIRVEQAGYLPYEAKLQVPGGRPLEVQIGLKPLKPLEPAAVGRARLSVTASGDNDVVSIDGKVVGGRQWAGELSSGEHVVRVTAPHKKPHESRVQLVAGSSRSLQISLEDDRPGSHAWLWVTSGAVLLAGAAVGGYFLFKPDEKPGAHPEGSLATIHLPFQGGAR